MNKYYSNDPLPLQFMHCKWPHVTLLCAGLKGIWMASFPPRIPKRFFKMTKTGRNKAIAYVGPHSPYGPKGL